MLKIGMVVDNRYKILREIGRGGTSCVYLAENIRLHNYWAIKEIYKGGVAGYSVKSNILIAESSILTKLRHPGLPSIIDILNTPHSYLIVMEYIEGISLDKVLETKGACSESDVLKWGCQLCDVLEYLHSQTPSIIYRDMKPANIMLKPDGNIVLIDFGMAREFKDNNRHDTSNLGTHGYAAPEQYNGFQQSDARTDIYSLGVTLYHLVTGHDPCLPPYGISSICSFNSSLSWQLDQIIQRCTQLQPELRYQSASELNSALNSITSDGWFMPDIEPEQKSKKWVWLFVLIPIVILVPVIIAISSMNSTSNSYMDSIEGMDGFFTDAYDDYYENDDVTLYFEQDVYIGEEGQREYYTFNPEKTGYYNIYSISGEEKPVIWLSDSEDSLLYEGNTTGGFDDFEFSYWLYEGETYYIETTLYYLDQAPPTGEYWICIEYTE